MLRGRCILSIFKTARKAYPLLWTFRLLLTSCRVQLQHLLGAPFLPADRVRGPDITLSIHPSSEPFCPAHLSGSSRTRGARQAEKAPVSAYVLREPCVNSYEATVISEGALFQADGTRPAQLSIVLQRISTR